MTIFFGGGNISHVGHLGGVVVGLALPAPYQGDAGSLISLERDQVPLAASPHAAEAALRAVRRARSAKRRDQDRPLSTSAPWGAPPSRELARPQELRGTRVTSRHGPRPVGISCAACSTSIPWSGARGGRRRPLNVSAPSGGRCSGCTTRTGCTRIVGSEDRDDIEVTAQKTARAESDEAAEALLDQIRLSVFDTSGDAKVDLEVEVPRRWNRRGAANLCIKIPLGTWTSGSPPPTGGWTSKAFTVCVRARSTNGSANVTRRGRRHRDRRRRTPR